MVDYPTPSPDSPKFGQTPPTQPQPVAEKGGFKDAKWLFVGGSIVGTLLIGFISVYQWLAPMIPASLALGMGVLLSGLIAFLLCEAERASAFVKGLLVWTLLAAPTALWALAPVRAAAVDIFGAKLAKPAQTAALSDHEPLVRLRACVALGVENKGTMAREIMARFYQTPKMSARCVQEVAQSDPDGAARLASAYVGEWHASLRGHEDAAICRGTPKVLEMSGYNVAQPAIDLTECAATYSSDEVSVCCADALAAHYSDPATYVDALGSPDALPVTRRAALFTALVPYAFVSLDADRRPLPEFETNLLRSEEHTSELQSRPHLVCRLLLEKKKKKIHHYLTLYI